MKHVTTIQNRRIRVPNGMNFEYAPSCSCGWRITSPVKHLKTARVHARGHRLDHRPPQDYFGLGKKGEPSPLIALATIVGGHRDPDRAAFLVALPGRLAKAPYDLLVKNSVYVDARLQTIPHGNTHRGRSTHKWLTRWQERIMMGLRP